ncbi:MAG: hypothetical protein C4295_12570 [Candidatus Fervidibacterota bacterium]
MGADEKAWAALGLTTGMRRNKHRLPNTLARLVDYYLQCLALERQGEVSLNDREFFGDKRLNPRFYPVPEVPSDWEELLSSPAARQALSVAHQRAETTILFAPFLTVTQDQERGQRRWEPVAGVFCLPSGGQLQIDPADLFLGNPFSDEVPPDDLQTVRAQLEHAARQGPLALRQTVLNLLPGEEVRFVPPHRLSEIEPPAILALAGFWVVGEPSYDRALVDELKELRTATLSGTALSFLHAPPMSSSPSFSDILWAIANPICPTLSQAIALAHTFCQPITVITGPPGTGKTRVIVGLIIQHLLDGKSVLLASRINRAVDAAVELAERLMGKGSVLRTGNEQVRTQLAQTLAEMIEWEKWQAEGELFAHLSQLRSPRRLADARQECLQIAYRIEHLCQSIAQQAKRLEPFGLRPVDNRWHRFWWDVWWWLLRGEKRWQKLRNDWDELERFWKEWQEQWLPQIRLAQIAALWERLTLLLQRSRHLLRELMMALDDQKARLCAFAQLAQAGFPIALTTLSVGQNLPLQPSMVDTLIIDEASSCDPASLLPLLYRAKRVIIVGDPKQLDHVTKERWKKVDGAPSLRSRNGTLFEAHFGVSAFSLMQQLVDGETFWLTDHFRCPPPIIAFSNETFYVGRLRIHTNCQESEPVKLVRVSGNHSRRGVNRSLTNREQVLAALKQLLEWISKHPNHTIGLVAPYRAFVNDVLEELHSNPTYAPLKERWERQELVIGTAHRFQGSEVDYLVFATVAGDNAKGSERQWVEFPNLFNVAITRARRQLVILVSPAFERYLVLTKKLLRAQLITLHTDMAGERRFARQVSDELKRLGIPHRFGCRFHGDEVDLLEDSPTPRWGVLLCGWDELAALTPLDFLRWHDRLNALQKRGLEVSLIFPREFETLLAHLLMKVPHYPTFARS